MEMQEDAARAAEADGDRGEAGDEANDLQNFLMAQQGQLAAAVPQIPVLMGQYDPNRMVLSPEACAFALELKAAVQRSPEVDCPNDFWCAQYALVDDSVSSAVERAWGLQQFREEYGIIDNYEFGCRCIQDLMELFPGLFLSFDFSGLDGTYAIVSDIQQFDMSALKLPRHDLIWIRAAYFAYQVLCCDLESIRRGACIIHECQGYDWKRNMDIKIWQQLYTELTSNYPLKIGKLRCFHTGTFFNLVVSMFKRFMPLDFQRQFKVGMNAPARLDTLYNIPSSDEAQQRCLTSMQEALWKRYQNESSFRLDTS